MVFQIKTRLNLLIPWPSIEFCIYLLQFNRKQQFLMEEDQYSSRNSNSEINHSYNSMKRQISDPPIQRHQTNELVDLSRAKQRFKLFINQIRHISHAPIRQNILVYYQGQKKSDKSLQSSMKPESILKKIDLRIEKMIKTKKLKRNWGEEDLKILVWVVSKYCDLKNIDDVEKDIDHEDWKCIASVIPGVTAESCMFKWLSIKKVTLATHNWTKGESDILANIVKQRLQSREGSGQIKDWKEISQELYKMNIEETKVYRNAKQCRQHWTCYLSPQLKKGPWQLHEDVRLLKYIKDNRGLKKWSQIARHFEGRTENALKNRYTLIIEKQKKLPRNKNRAQLDLIKEYLQKCYVDQFTVNVKTEQQGIFQEQSSMKNYQEQMAKTPIIKKEQINCFDTNESVITPARVQKFNINDFQLMNINFLKHIQPGVIESDGTFKKISSSSHKEVHSKSKDIQDEVAQVINQKKGPFRFSYHSQ